MEEVITIGVDLAKNVFQLHGIDGSGEVVIRRQLRRARLLPFFRKLPPCLVGMEACATAHHWAREIGNDGRAIIVSHDQRLHAKKQSHTNRESAHNRGYASPVESQPDIVRAIGMVTIETSMLDVMLGRLLGGILGIEETFSTAVYLTPKSAFARLQMIENALDEYEENDDIKEIRKLIARAKSITNKRHSLMHSLYGLSPNESVVRHQMPLTSASLDCPIPILLEDLETIIANIRALIDDLVQCAGQLFYERAASAPLLFTPHIRNQDDPTGTPYLPEKVWTRKP